MKIYCVESLGALGDQGIGNLSQDHFAASKHQTITKFVAKRGIPVLQLEINGTWLLPPASAPDQFLQRHRFAQLLAALVTFTCSIDDTVECKQTVQGASTSPPPIACAEIVGP